VMIVNDGSSSQTMESVTH